jgi:hypothetical protein
VRCLTHKTTLDRVQRAALHRELELDADPYGDFAISIRNGDRGYVVAHRARLGRMIEALDTIGWTEQPDVPDVQPVRFGRSLAAWARREAKNLGQAFHEWGPEGPDDEDLDAYAALCAIGTGETA